MDRIILGVAFICGIAPVGFLLAGWLIHHGWLPVGACLLATYGVLGVGIHYNMG